MRHPLAPSPLASFAFASLSFAALSFAALSLVALFAAPRAAAFDGAFVVIEGGSWDVSGGPVEYVLEPTGSEDVDDGSDLQALRDAFRAWECVRGTSIRFAEGDGAGPATLDLSDGKNTLFWDENREFDLGPGTLGVTLGDTSGTRTAADIVFNGDFEWSTDDGPSATDVGAIASHEIGHFLGLDHPCDFQGGQETNCNGPERSVMTPAWGGELDRAPLNDDEEGVVALYPSGDADSTCDGPKTRGQECDCSGDCVEGLVCAALAGDDKKVCADTCASDASDCGNGFACVLSPPAGDEPAPGTCIAHDEGDKPAGAVCTGGSECGSGTCALLFDVQRSLCQEACSSTSDCGAGVCFEGFCLAGVEVQECPDENPPGCSCAAERASTSGSASSVVPGLLALVALLARAGRGRRR